MVLGEKRRRIVTKFELAGSPQLLYQRPDLITVEARERIAKQHESRLVYPTCITERTHEVLAQQLDAEKASLQTVEDRLQLVEQQLAGFDEDRRALVQREAGLAEAAQGKTKRREQSKMVGVPPWSVETSKRIMNEAPSGWKTAELR